MICYVDMEHEDAARWGVPCTKQRTGARSLHQAYRADVQRRLEETSRAGCVVRRYNEVTLDWLDATDIEALILSGNFSAWDAYDEAKLQGLRDVVRRAPLPILGVCGGLQFIAMAHGAPIGPMRALKEGEEDLASGFGAGYLKEWGYEPVDVVQSDPLFESLETPVFLQAHYWEVKRVPDGFDLLASTDACHIQALRQRGKPVYGTQFHPEAYIVEGSDRKNCLIERVYPTGYPGREPDGRQLLVNFFHVAGVGGQADEGKTAT